MSPQLSWALLQEHCALNVIGHGFFSSSFVFLKLCGESRESAKRKPVRV